MNNKIANYGKCDYISREAVLARRHGCVRDCSSCDFARDGDSWCQGKLFVVDVLSIPAADVQPANNNDKLMKLLHEHVEPLAKIVFNPDDGFSLWNRIEYCLNYAFDVIPGDIK